MNKFLVLAVAGLVALSSVTRAQAYTVNGHEASKAEVQFLASYNAPGGRWMVDGFGMSQVSDEHPAAAVLTSTPKCWYVLDVRLCD
jgi:hypothetical protein